MYELYRTKSPFGYEHKEVIVDLTDEQKKEVRLLLKELFNYCTVNRIKDGVSWKEMALYQYVRGFGLFCGGCSLRNSTYYRYLWTTNVPTWNMDDNIMRICQDIEKTMGKDNYSKFWNELNNRMRINFSIKN